MKKSNMQKNTKSNFTDDVIVMSLWCHCFLSEWYSFAL